MRLNPRVGNLGEYVQQDGQGLTAVNQDTDPIQHCTCVYLHDFAMCQDVWVGGCFQNVESEDCIRSMGWGLVRNRHVRLCSAIV